VIMSTTVTLSTTEAETAACSLCALERPAGEMVSPGDGTHYCPTATSTNPDEAAACLERALARRAAELAAVQTAAAGQVAGSGDQAGEPA